METCSHIFRVNPREINYVQVTLGSYDGMVAVRTIDPGAALIELQMAPGCEDFVFEVIKHLVEMENISMGQDNAAGQIGPECIRGD
jgi:hypothetical protein